MKRFLLTLAVLMVSITAAFAEVLSGSCGTNVTYTLDTETGVLKIEGTGKMSNYSWGSAPWYSNRSYVKEAQIAQGVTSIGDYAFYYCSSLTSITIPSSVTSVGDYACTYCPDLISIKVDPNNTVYDSRGNCNAIIKTATNTLILGCKSTTIPSSVTSIGSYAFDGCSSLTSITIPEGVTSIGDHAFNFCSSLTSINIPSSLTSIGSYAFNGCSLTSVNISNIAAWCRIDFQDSSANPLSMVHHLIVNGEEVKDLVIPENVTSIGSYAFNGCYSLTSITIPNSVTSIGAQAFYGCSSLTSINIPEGVTSIGGSAFFGCSSLTSIIIPESVTSIGGSAFYGCYNLQRITVLNPIPPRCVGIATFACENLRDKYDVYTYATLHVPAGSKEAYSSAHEWRYFPKIKEDMEIDGRTYYAPLKVKQGTMGYTEQSIKADEKYTIYIGSLGDSKINSITFNGRDVTDELVNGYYTTPEIKAASELSISYEVTSPNAVRSAELNNVRVKGYNGEVTISGIETESDVYVYDTTGKMVTNESKARDEIRLSVPENELYIVKVGQRTFKIAM